MPLIRDANMATNREIDIVLNEFLSSLQNNYPETTEFLSSKLAELNSSLDASIADYNAAIDEIELRDGDIASLSQQINELQLSLELAKLNVSVAPQKPSLMVSALTTSLENKEKELHAALRQYEIVFDEKKQLASKLDAKTKSFGELADRLRVLNAKVADVDFIRDTNAKLHEQIINRDQEIERLSVDLRIANGASISKIEAATARVSQLNRTTAKQADQIKELERELRDYRKIDPARIKKNNVQLKKDLAEKTAGLKKSQRDCNKSLNAQSKLETSNKTLITTLQDAEIELKRLYSALARHDGAPLKQKFVSTNGKVHFYIYEFEYGLIYGAQEGHTPLLSDLDFNVEVKSSIGISLTVSASNWLQPYFPLCSEFNDIWPHDLTIALCELFYDRCKDTHSQIIAKLQWAKHEPLSNVPGITPRELKILADNNMTTIFHVCSLSEARLYKEIKGMGDKTAHAMWLKCDKYVKLFEQLNNQKVA